MSIYYENSVGERLQLDEWPIMIQDEEQLLGYEWSYATLGDNSIDSFYRGMKSANVTIAIFADSKEEFDSYLNKMSDVFEKDILSRTSGKLYMNGYYMNCFIYGKDFSEYEPDFYSTDEKMKLLSVDGAWTKETLHRFRYSDDPKEDAPGKGYPYGYPYDYSPGSGHVATLRNENITSCDFIMEISGYAFEPSISIGGHTYEVNVTVNENETLIIDSKNRTVILQRANRIKENIFYLRDRRSYIFEKIPSGESLVYWAGNFDFKIKLIEERSEPLWT